MGEVCQQPQALSESVKRLDSNPKGLATGKLTQSKSGQARKEMIERPNWIQDKFDFLKMHIRCKGLSKLSGLKSPALGASASTASAHDISRGSTDMDSLEMRMRYQIPQNSHQLQAPV